MSLFGSFWKKGSEETQKPASSSGKWQVGDKIANQYEILEILGGEGKSGMGIVYVCYEPTHNYKQGYALKIFQKGGIYSDKAQNLLKNGCFYVLKTFQNKYLASEEMQRLFEREAFIWAKLEKHPYIVRAWFVTELENRLFIILEYIPPSPGGKNTLTHYLGNLTFPEILKFSIQFCYGMEYAYSKGVDCHRDIKPDNIMVTPDIEFYRANGRSSIVPVEEQNFHRRSLKLKIKITDFGLAKAFQEIQLKENIVSSEENQSLSIFQSKGKRVCGTLPYMAPEQFDSYADKRSDIYAFGIVLYQMVTNGRLPFIGRNVEEYERLHKYERVPIISSPLFPIIQKCLQQDPGSRYSDFISIREELQSLLFKEVGEKVIIPESEELNPAELEAKANSLYALNRFNEAINYYDKVLEMEPKGIEGEAYRNKGVALSKVKRYQEAIVCIDKAIEINPKEDEYQVTKAAILAGLGRFDEALKCVEEAIKINPDPSHLLLKQEIIKLKLLDCIEKKQGAVVYYDKATGESGDHLLWYNKGLTLACFFRYKKALICFDRAIEINPRSAKAWAGKGNALMMLNRNDEALVCIEKALEIDPHLSYAHELKQILQE